MKPTTAATRSSLHHSRQQRQKQQRQQHQRKRGGHGAEKPVSVSSSSAARRKQGDPGNNTAVVSRKRATTDLTPSNGGTMLTRANGLQRIDVVRPGAVAVDGPRLLIDAAAAPASRRAGAHSNAILLDGADASRRNGHNTATDDAQQRRRMQQQQGAIIGAYLADEDDEDPDAMNRQLFHREVEQQAVAVAVPREGRTLSSASSTARGVITPGPRMLAANNDASEAAAAVVPASSSASSSASPAENNRKWKRRMRLYGSYCVAVLLPLAILGTVVGVVFFGRGGEKTTKARTSVSTPPASSQQSSFWTDADDSATPSALSPPQPTRTTTATSQQQQPSPDDDASGATPSFLLNPSASCAGGWYYYTYEDGSKIGAVDVSSSGSSTNQYISAPDCPLYFLAFDVAGTAHGQCYYGDANGTLVRVNLTSGRTTSLAEFPQYPSTSNSYFGLAFNPANGLFYTTVRAFPPPNPLKLVQIDGRNDNWTFTSIGFSLEHTFRGFAINSMGEGFGIARGNEMYAVDFAEGSLSYVATLPSVHYNIAFDGTDTLYGIGADSPAPLSLFNVSVDTAPGRGTVRTTYIKDTFASFTWGGAFCPL